MTIHAAKGLEFPVVFVIGRRRVFPHANSIRDGDVEEERRLCYVAMTRAEDRLVLTRARRRTTFQDVRRNPPSRFLDEIPVESLHERVAQTRRQKPKTSWTREMQVETDWSVNDVQYQTSDGFAPGVHVWHAQFGAGQIIEIQRGMRTVLTVEFPGMEPVKVVSDYVSVYDV